MSGPLDVVATIRVQDGRADDVVAVIAEYVDAVRAEEGCLRYDLFRVRKDPGALLMVERWASKEALRAHGTVDHFVAMSTRLAELLAAAPVVQVLEPALVEPVAP
jgi:quinol monooxygenase YgiN